VIKRRKTMSAIKVGHHKSWVCHLRTETYKTKLYKTKMFKLRRNKFLEVLTDLLIKGE
jgi:hypothetical protein